MQGMGSTPIHCINVNIPTDIVLKLDADAKVDAGPKCERTFKCSKHMS